MAKGRQIDLMSKVQKPRKPFITKPAMIHLISEIPEPAAYGAYALTRLAAARAKIIYSGLDNGPTLGAPSAYRETEIEEVVEGPKRCPSVPIIAF